jgi:hypothetical protein
LFLYNFAKACGASLLSPSSFEIIIHGFFSLMMKVEPRGALCKLGPTNIEHHHP